MDISTPSHATKDSERPKLLELSNAMVRIYKEQFGRGPTKVKTSFADDDTVISTLENSMTPVERSMLAMGEQQRVEETRLLFQRATQGQFIAEVEKITGRKVRAFVSGTDAQRDVSTEVFYLAPEGSDSK